MSFNIVLLGTLMVSMLPENFGENNTKLASGSEVVPPDSMLFQWKLAEYSVHLVVITFIFCVIVFKVIFHNIPLLSKYVRESMLLIFVGVLFGLILEYGFGDDAVAQFKLTPDLFFLYLLPPNILKASYRLYHPKFREYLGVVIIYSFFASICNLFIEALALYGLYSIGAFGPTKMQLNFRWMFVFSAAIVSIDPVSILAIFQGSSVNLPLYYIILAEAMFNNAVVYHNLFTQFLYLDEVTTVDIVLCVVSYFTVTLGGLLIGTVFGIISCLIARFRSYLSIVTLLLMAYGAYIMCEVVGWSGIMAIIACGLFQASYAFNSLQFETITVLYTIVQWTAEIAEAVIFLFLGVEVVSKRLAWETGFVLWSLVVCLVTRAILVFSIIGIINFFGVDQAYISFHSQIILFYSGFRGAVAYCLILFVNPQESGEYGDYNTRVMNTATLVIIFFTTIVMGGSLPPLVSFLNRLEHKEENQSMFHAVNNRIIKEVLTEIEVLTKVGGRDAFHQAFLYFDRQYLRVLLQREKLTHELNTMKDFEKIILAFHGPSLKPIDMESVFTSLLSNISRSELQYLIACELCSEGCITKELMEANVATDGSSEATRDDVTEKKEKLFPILSRHTTLLAPDGRLRNFRDILKHALLERALSIQILYTAGRTNCDIRHSLSVEEDQSVNARIMGPLDEAEQETNDEDSGSVSTNET